MFSLVLQCQAVARYPTAWKSSTKSVIITPPFVWPTNKDLRAVSIYARRQKAREGWQINAILPMYRWSLLRRPLLQKTHLSPTPSQGCQLHVMEGSKLVRVLSKHPSSCSSGSVSFRNHCCLRRSGRVEWKRLRTEHWTLDTARACLKSESAACSCFHNQEHRTQCLSPAERPSRAGCSPKRNRSTDLFSLRPAACCRVWATLPSVRRISWLRGLAKTMFLQLTLRHRSITPLRNYLGRVIHDTTHV